MRLVSHPFVWLATCFGIGKLPVAPGTWGSLAGLAVGVACLATGWERYLWLLCAIAGFVMSAWICTRAEEAIGRTDPGEVVLDEFWAMMFLVLLSGAGYGSGFRLILLFVLFRVFDIAKPFPLKRLAKLPKGWGVMADDAGAAVYTGIFYFVVVVLR